jgi:HicA toxin of bacterial toxin-antitoxin,
MGSGFYSQLRSVLLANGCTFLRNGKGSHEVWHSPISGKSFPVAVTIMSRHLANAIMKQAGINHRF